MGGVENVGRVVVVKGEKENKEQDNKFYFDHKPYGRFRSFQCYTIKESATVQKSIQ